MLELAAQLLPLVRSGQPVAVATAIDVIGGSPHPPGTSMAVTADGRVLGSVSGGCVEAAALAACRAVLAGGPSTVRRFGFGDADAARAGLACGGELDVLVAPLAGAGVEAELRAAAAGRPAAIGLVTGGSAALAGRVVAALEGADDAGGGPERRIAAAVAAHALAGRPGGIEVACGPATLRVFADVAAPAARFVVVGATALGAALAAGAAALGYAVTICDPRPDFARPDRFPGARVVVGAPHAHLAASPVDGRTVVCVVGHDEDLDPLTVAIALERGAGYVGALGSRATAARRAERLRALGVPGDLAARLHAPIGLDLGASTPAETAVSVLAEVLAARTGATAMPLGALAGPIHAAARQ